MDPSTQKAKEIFLNLVGNVAPDDWDEHLEKACAGEDGLELRVRELLHAHRRNNSFLENPVTGIAATIDQPVAEQPGTYIGPYKLVEEIGEGGMGSVFMALQKTPVRRQVALKVIKPGMDSKHVVSRFEAERQALAMMDHPNIARVFDGGATESGRPYFVMELVKGIPITDYCDRYRMTTSQRLELFEDVCRAVQHAHQKGIIHRDLKPSNILVTVLDGRAIPKVIDFGIAKATTGHLTEDSLVTGFSQLIGTPMYMSPEQAEVSAADVDTRSDVYSLGVLLYELLTGTTPFDQERMSSVSFDEFRRIVREEDPPRPSTRLSTLNAALTTIAERHHTDPRTLSRQLNGELDWIVMKALEKDRRRRYESANDLAKDVQRYLVNEPVEACPPSRTYRFRKFARRNKVVLTSSAAVLISLLMALVATTLVAINSRERVQRRLTLQEGINSALTEVARLRGPDQPTATATGGADSLVRAREQLQRALALAESGPADADLVARVQELSNELDQEQRDRDLLAALDHAWLALGDMATFTFGFDVTACVSGLRDAFEAYGLPIGTGPPEVAAAMIKTRPEAVRQAVVAALDEWRALVPTAGFGVHIRDSEVFVDAILPGYPIERDGRLKLGDQLIGVGAGRDGTIIDTCDLTPTRLETLAQGKPGAVLRLKVIPQGTTGARIYEIEPDPLAAWLKAVVDAVDSDPWRRRVRAAFDLADDAEQRTVLQKLAKEVDVERQPASLLTRLAVVLSEREAVDGAVALLRKVRQKHPSDFCANLRLASLLRISSTPDFAEAIHYYTTAVALRPNSAMLRNELGLVLSYQGKLEEAIAEYRDAIQMQANVAEFHTNLGTALKSAGKQEEAVAELREAIRLKPHLAEAHTNLGIIFEDQGKPEQAIAEYLEAIRLAPRQAETHTILGNFLLTQGKTEEAIAEHRKAIQLQPNLSEAHYNLGNALVTQCKWEEAIAAYRQAIRLAPDEVEGYTNLGTALSEQGKIDQAIAAYREAIRVKPDHVTAHANLGSVLQQQGRLEEAILEYRETLRINPDYAGVLNNLAWLLATASDPKWNQPEQAAKLAEKAVELEPRSAHCWNTLCVAQYRSGNYQGAIDSANKSLTLGSQNDPTNWFFLAMAHQRIGHNNEADTCFDTAVQTMDNHAPQDEQLLNLRAEAAKVVGIPAPPTTAKDLPEAIK